MVKVTPLILIVSLLVSGCKEETRSNDAETPSPPNIVLILADDFGVGDIQAHYPENKIPTPHLDRLVSQGRSFTDAHSASAVCTPTRYGILTGRYAWRTPLQEWVLAAYESPLIEEGRQTLPGFLQGNGYHTALIGKWHLGMVWAGDTPLGQRRPERRNSLREARWDFTRPFRQGPTERGFDYYFGVDLPNFPPFTYLENDRVVTQPTATYRYDPKGGVVMPRSFDGSPMAPGWRFDSILPTITERAASYIYEQAASEKPFFLFFSQTSPHEPVTPSADYLGNSGINPVADFVMETDASVGRILEALDESGQSDNTLVIFTADNGHSHYTGWEELIAAGHQPSGPYRGHKGNVWEGGHRVPFIARWPAGGVAAESQSDHPLTLNDLYATVADILGADLPSDAAEDSFSFLPALTGSEPPPRPVGLVSHSRDGEFAYREGEWKLVLRKPEEKLADSRGRAVITELYRLTEDVAEQNDLADKFPERVAQLRKRLNDLVDSGSSREGVSAQNDGSVVVDTIQSRRYVK
jgi:arylsulfatase A-like enzyme